MQSPQHAPARSLQGPQTQPQALREGDNQTEMSRWTKIIGQNHWVLITPHTDTTLGDSNGD